MIMCYIVIIGKKNFGELAAIRQIHQTFLLYGISLIIVYVDVNECAGDHRCHHLCNNTDGSFYCYCNPGYMLDSNGTTCKG